MKTRQCAVSMGIFAALLLMVAVTDVNASTFGRQTPGTQASSGLREDFKRGSRFTLTEAGTLQSLCAYLDFAGGASNPQSMRLALYRDVSGVPGEKVVDSDTKSFTVNSPVGWNCFNTALYPVAAGSYWIVIHSGGSGALVRDYYDGAEMNWYGNSDTFSDGASNTFGSGNAGAGTISAYATYFSASEKLLRTFGKTTVGPLVSKGMTAEFKRASRFTLTEPAQLEAFTVYLDGLGGGASGAELIYVALYRDANGVPGAKVSESTENQRYVRIGAPAQWMTFPATPALLEPGRYWISILAGGAGGVARNYADSTPGNWAGNANPCCAHTQSFGPASSGNGTISVFALYKPGAAQALHQFGRTDVALKPSKGLSANFARGSMFYLRTANYNAVANALYAYLDGRGGQTGSQQVRMQLYSAHLEQHDIFLIAQSEVVSIAAGTPPGWVRFPISATSIDGNYLIVIESGGTAGVVRNYGDGPANWIGAPDGGFPGEAQFYTPPPFEPAATFGTVTLSVYADYFIPR